MKRRIVPMLLGLSAQGLTILSTLVPIAFDRLDAVIQLVTVMAVATALIPGLCLAVSSRLPVVSDPTEAFAVVFASAATLALFSALFAAAGLLVVDIRSFALACSILIAAQGAYTISGAIATRNYDYALLMRMRLAYGLGVVVVTLICCVLNLEARAFVLAPASASAIAASLGLLAHIGRLSHHLGHLSWRGVLRQVFQARSLTVAQFLSGYSGQVGAIAAAGLGPLAASWAISVRFTAGFQTVASQILAPSVDIDVSRAIREPEDGALRRAVMRGSLMGGALALVAAPVVLALCLLLGAEEIGARETAALCFGVIGYQVLSVWLLPSERVMGLLGGQQTRLIWDGLRAAALAPVLLLNSGIAKAVWLGVVGTLFYIAYMAICWRLAKSGAGRPARWRSSRQGLRGIVRHRDST